MSDPQARLQALSEDFQKLQGGMFVYIWRGNYADWE
ncbi:hypothetical protein BFJ68_g15341 [Fusarium oxysporum]|uniref:Uncharacterized protein n=1 Tax=Fusarium oxysporum TaxID=5507 RepID=A0A420PNC4_FUSOX|nr:hypothetical protein BFJ68_g15341 [Fusarium oxysporum]